MAFQVKDFTSIVASQIAHMRATQGRITDYTVGSVTRTLVEAPAIEIDEFYQRMLFGLLESIPIAVFDAFGFAAQPALASAGDVRFTSAVRNAIARAIASTLPGGVLYVDLLTDAALSVREVERVIVGMNENIQAGVSEALLLPTLSS